VGQVTYLLLFRFLYFHQERDLGTLEGTLGDVGIGTLGAQKSVTVRASEPVRSALRLMHDNEISGIPVLNDEGVLLDMYCDSDVLQLPDLDLDLNVGLALEQVAAPPSAPLLLPLRYDIAVYGSKSVYGLK
jgi:CBS domain-containing protein